jgi:hypothetical protein
MVLSHFITTLLAEGKVSVQGQLAPPEESDIISAGEILYRYYGNDILEMPLTAPAYSDKAAVWAAAYLYKAIHLAINRDAEAVMIRELLSPFPEPITPSVIYSADLMLRHLPQLLHLAKGLAPADILVEELKHTAGYWPFSSVGIELDTTTNEEILFSHPSLKYAYIDRIIREKDKKRINTAAMKNNVHEAAGEHLSVLWPGFDPVIN